MTTAERPPCQICHSTPRAPGRSRCWPCYHRYQHGLERADGMRILFLDIETTPNQVYTWGLWQQNVGVNQIIRPGGMLCFSAQWLGEENQFFRGPGMVEAAWHLLNEADVVVHFYGSRFDIPHLNREFVTAGLTPPSPYQQVDLKNIVARRFKFPSNKLEYVSRALGLPGKVKHEGFELWTACMAGDGDAWGRMEEYNRQDVVLLEELYQILLPWIPGHPNRHLFDGTGGCPTCGGTLVEDGVYRTKLSVFRRFACQDCGAWSRSNRREVGASTQEACL